jgi:hypothetical protein
VWSQLGSPARDRVLWQRFALKQVGAGQLLATHSQCARLFVPHLQKQLQESMLPTVQSELSRMKEVGAFRCALLALSGC